MPPTATRPAWQHSGVRPSETSPLSSFSLCLNITIQVCSLPRALQKVLQERFAKGSETSLQTFQAVSTSAFVLAPSLSLVAECAPKVLASSLRLRGSRHGRTHEFVHFSWNSISSSPPSRSCSTLNS